MGCLLFIYWFWYVVSAIDLLLFLIWLIFYPEKYSQQPGLYYGLLFFFLYVISPLFYVYRGVLLDFICSIKIKGVQLNEYKVASILFAIAGISLIVYFSVSSKNQDNLSFNVKPNRPMPAFLCEANKIYLINAEHGIKGINVNYKLHKIPDFKRCAVIFNYNTKIIIDPYLDGIWFKDGSVEIKKRESEPLNDYAFFIYLTPEKYSDYSMPVNAGIRFDTVEQNELFYVGEFKKDNLLEETLVKKGDWSFWFYEDKIIKFRAAEVPFFLYLKKWPYVEKMNVIVDRPGSNYNSSVYNIDAIYLKPGQIFKTNYWLDKDDSINTKTRPSTELTYLVDDKIISRIKAVDFFSHHKIADYDGYLTLVNKSQHNCVITEISIGHSKNWKLNLKNGESYKINLENGDKISHHSGSRYYVNEHIMDANRTYEQRGRGDFVFKGSINPQTIYIKVLTRRGY